MPSIESVEWTNSEIIALCKFTRRYIYTAEMLHDLEVEARDGTGTEACSAFSHNCSADNINKDFEFFSDDHIGKLLRELLTCNILRTCLLPWALEKSAQAYCQLGVHEAENPYSDMSRRCRRNLFMSAMRKSILDQFRAQVIKANRMQANCPSLLALPVRSKIQTFKHLLFNETMSDLMYKGIAVQDEFLGEKCRAMILSDLKKLDYNGHFRYQTFGSPLSSQQLQHRYCCLSIRHIEAAKFRGLYELACNLATLPYELTARTSGFCQTAETIQCSILDADGSQVPILVDSGITDDEDTGRKYTVIYFPNTTDWQESYGGDLILTQREKITSCSANDSLLSMNAKPQLKFKPVGDRLVLFKSRNLTYSVSETHQKRYSVSFWISGPKESQGCMD